MNGIFHIKIAVKIEHFFIKCFTYSEYSSKGVDFSLVSENEHIADLNVRVDVFLENTYTKYTRFFIS